MNSYLQRRANPWVSMAVLAGGLVSAVLLFFIFRIESALTTSSIYAEEEYFLELEETYGH